MGRRPGSKNKPKITKEEVSAVAPVPVEAPVGGILIPEANIPASPGNDTKQDLGASSPIKRGRGRPPGSGKKKVITLPKEENAIPLISDPEKIELIKEINQIDSFAKYQDLEFFSVEQLKFHLTKLKRIK